jgi:2-polyprenyl-3-methyl-5-hydroxy-6-metoxy-1,4-benzoquinol methylase
MVFILYNKKYVNFLPVRRKKGFQIDLETNNMAGYTFEYSHEFEESIIEFHKGKERLTFYKDSVMDHLGGPKSRLSAFVQFLYPEIEYHCGDLESKRVLDFGCGTGATTVTLAMHCKNVVAYDINKKSVEICKKRLEEHGLADRVKIYWASDISELAGQLGKFDLILSNAVLQNVPLSIKGLRENIIKTLFSLLNKQGCLYINETANRLWPKDDNTTKLWWIPWTKPGSQWAYKKAIKAKRHVENPETHSNGPLGLEERGAWGVTYFELKRYLKGQPYEVVNSLPGHNKHRVYKVGKAKTRVAEFVIYWLVSKWTKIPVTALTPSLLHLMFRKTA